MTDDEKIEALKEVAFTLAVCSIELRREWSKTRVSEQEDQRRKKVVDSINAATKAVGTILLPLEAKQIRADYDGK